MFARINIFENDIFKNDEDSPNTEFIFHKIGKHDITDSVNYTYLPDVWVITDRPHENWEITQSFEQRKVFPLSPIEPLASAVDLGYVYILHGGYQKPLRESEKSML